MHRTYSAAEEMLMAANSPRHRIQFNTYNIISKRLFLDFFKTFLCACYDLTNKDVCNYRLDKYVTDQQYPVSPFCFDTETAKNYRMVSVSFVVTL